MPEIGQLLDIPRLSSLRWGTTIVAAAVAIAVIGMAAFVAKTLYDHAVNNADGELAAVSRVTSERTFQTLSAADILSRSIQVLASIPAVDDVEDLRVRATTRAFYNSLVDLQKLLPQVDVAAVVDSDGLELASSRHFPAPDVNMVRAKFFRTLQEQPDRGLIITGPVINTLTGQWMLYLVRPLTDSRGRFIGIVMVGIRSTYFESYFASIQVGPTFAVLLADQDGRLISRWPRIDDKIGQPLPDNEGSSIVADQGTIVKTIPGLDGRIRQAAMTPLRVQDTQLSIWVSLTRAQILHSWHTNLIWVGAFAGTSLAVLALLTWTVWRAVDAEETWSRALLERENRLSRQAVELAAARDDAERASRVRGQFLANMSHELRTPLNAVLGFSEILERELFGPLGDRRYKEFAGDIHRSGQHLLDIISNILDLTKIDAGRLELNEQDVDLTEIMRISGRLIADLATAGEVQFSVEIPEGPIWIHGDATRLQQVLLNLLSNAVKFTPGGKSVRLSIAVTGTGVDLIVADTGIGMTPAEAALAMQPFRQIDNSLARKYQGTGLGLPLAKSLVELHGGYMTMETASGVGTTITVHLPAWRLESIEAEAARSPAEAG
jgi:signal transduction histidine kinase